ncbi:hypothetical protein PTKIN_Ptkin01aG0154900 [Pterospermum kingtungense]
MTIFFLLFINARSSGISGAKKENSEPLVAEAKVLMESRWWSIHSNRDADHCRWPGVRCNLVGSVTHICLSDHGLYGCIPSRIGALSNLKYLNLSSTYLSRLLEAVLKQN